MLGLQNEREWSVFCEKVLLDPELATDERFSTNSKRSAARNELRALIVDAFSTLTAEQVVAKARRRANRECACQRHARRLETSATAGSQTLA